MKKCHIIGHLPTPLGDMPSLVWQDGLYLFGGGSGDKVTDQIYRIDRDGHAAKGGKMPYASRGHAALLMGDKAYIMGGFAEGTLSHFQVCDLPTGTWEILPPLPQDTAWFSASCHQGRIYVVGGFSIPAGYWQDILCYDPAKGRWEVIPGSFPQDIFPEKLLGSNSSLPYGDHILSFGGADGFDKAAMRAHPLGIVARYSPSTDQWEKLPLEITPREGLVAVARGEVIYLIGGAGGGAVHRYPYIERMDLAQGTVTPYAEMTLGRTGAACGIIDDQLIIAGGVVGAVNEMTDRIESVAL